ncbi:hypothetical protein CU041_19540 [Thalassospira povalilytica]|uniref:Uncharacterized protein n=1 Tax=Thalassospira povalilytica TaxID=732237 RepID=A0ABX4R4W1_9PROT|nr:hypothetical protein CU041_19540 [Thalassospira povalilytica]
MRLCCWYQLIEKRFQTDGVWFPKTYRARSIQLAEIAQKLSTRSRPIIPQANAHSFLSIFWPCAILTNL